MWIVSIVYIVYIICIVYVVYLVNLVYIVYVVRNSGIPEKDPFKDRFCVPRLPSKSTLSDDTRKIVVLPIKNGFLYGCASTPYMKIVHSFVVKNVWKHNKSLIPQWGTFVLWLRIDSSCEDRLYWWAINNNRLKSRHTNGPPSYFLSRKCRQNHIWNIITFS